MKSAARAIDRAIHAVEPATQAELARRLKLDYQQIHLWTKRGWVSPKHALSVEQVTGVPCADLLADVVNNKKRRRTK